MTDSQQNDDGAAARVAAALLTGSLAAAICCAGIPAPKEVSSSNEPPVWQVDLRKHGYQSDEYERSARADPNRQIAFADDSHLVVLNQSIKSATETTVRAFVLDTRSGEVQSSREWARNTPAYVFTGPNGTFAILGSKGTTLFSGDLQREIANSTHSVELMSPNGKRCAAPTRRDRREVWVAMNTQTLEETGSIPLSFTGSISETAVVTLTLHRGENPHVEILSTADSAPVRLPVASGTEPPRFVSEHAIILVSGRRFNVVSDTGDPILAGSLDDDWHQFVTSRDSPRFALLQQRWSELRGELASERISVFDLEKRKAIWSKEIRGIRGEPAARSGAALSPDGSMIAIRSLGTIMFFRLPAIQ